MFRRTMTTPKVTEAAEQKVSDLTVSQLRELIREVVLDCISERYEDFHRDLEFNPQFAAELLESAREAKEAGIPTIPDEQMAEIEAYIRERSQ
jgi:ADP-dependent phosphofructokinase/glucokinase